MILEGSTQPTAVALRSSYWKCMYIVWYVPPLVFACARSLYVITCRFISEYIEVPTAKGVGELFICFLKNRRIFFEQGCYAYAAEVNFLC